MNNSLPSPLAERVLAWFHTHGRKDLPWQLNPTPYSVWVSEIMLQQTQVTTVIPYYQRFMRTFPELPDLANANPDLVLQHWQGLGYYTRARNLHKAAQMVRDQYQGILPSTLEQLTTLPGIGRSTAGAILSLSLGQRQAILDGNVKRVLARYHAIADWTGTPAIQKKLWHYAEQHLPQHSNAAYTQAMMDMGATLCTRRKPLCLMCPLQADCAALQSGQPENYPAARPAKVLPEKHAWLAVIYQPNGTVLLQKRPPTGIWGGLWSMPEFASLEALHDWVKEWNQTDSYEALPTQKHTFSHFHLHLHPICIRLTLEPTRVMEAEHWLWYNSISDFVGGLSRAAQSLIKPLNKGVQI